ncbi:hypothetical protein M231_03564 [Tremella mesenterica]|uniref:Uncharacterized protein n=1 Tax=Tremella mesenterica TaxID=5217 RepID=A0A4V1M457_TREME|nr:hypothetical protein M231_03564 [Tremella mesenterica]
MDMTSPDTTNGVLDSHDDSTKSNGSCEEAMKHMYQGLKSAVDVICKALDDVQNHSIRDVANSRWRQLQKDRLENPRSVLPAYTEAMTQLHTPVATPVTSDLREQDVRDTSSLDHTDEAQQNLAAPSSSQQDMQTQSDKQHITGSLKNAIIRQHYQLEASKDQLALMVSAMNSVSCILSEAIACYNKRNDMSEAGMAHEGC